MRLITLLSTIFICQLGSTQILSETISVNQDATTRVAFPTINYGNIDSIYCGFEAATGAYQRLYLEFSMDALPPEAIITSAQLVLHPKSIMPGNNNDLTLSRLDSNWIDTSITWNNQPGVITSDQIQIADSETTDPIKHEFDVIDHLEYFNFYEHLNFGWELRMYSETGASNTGISYYSQECVTDSLRPRLEVEYIMPLDFDINVSHCNQDSTNGSYTVNVNEGGSGGLFALYYLRKRTDTTWVIQSSGVPGTLEDVESENLSPGLYALILRDSLYTSFPTSRRYLLEYYKWFLIGEEGKLTTVNMATPGGNSGESYFEDVTIGRNTQTNPGGTKYSDINYNTGSSFGTAFAVPTATFGYDNAGLLKFEMDFDPSLDFNSAELILNKHYYYNGHNSENSVNCRRITSWWRDAIVTWNTRPDVDSTVQYVLPTIATTGSGGGPDTLNLLSFVEFWQLNQDQNYGIEMCVNYGQIQGAHRQFKPSKFTNGPNLKLSFTVKPQFEFEYSETEENGYITINSPAGNVPYTYLLTQKSDINLDTIWLELKDSIPVDSVAFYAGESNSRNYTFSNLEPGKYYVSVYDNGSAEILTETFDLFPVVDLFDTTGIEINQDTLKLASGNSSGTVTYYLNLEDGCNGGFESEIVSLNGDYSLGFNSSDDSISIISHQFDYSIQVRTNQFAYFFNSDTLIDSISVALSDKVGLYKEGALIYMTKNGSKIFQTNHTQSATEDFKVEAVLSNSLASIGPLYPNAQLKKPKLKFEIEQPGCSDSEGTVKINFPNNSFFGVGITAYTITDQNGTVVANGSSPNNEQLPAGNYALNYTYSSLLGNYTYSTEFSIDYVVNWINIQDLTSEVAPSQIYPTNTNVIGSANSANQSLEDFTNKVSFLSPSLGSQSSLSYNDISIVNSSDEELLRLWVFQPSGQVNNRWVYVYNELGYYTSFIAPGNKMFEVELVDVGGDITSVSIYYDNSLKTTFSSTKSGPVKLSLDQYGKTYLVDAKANFCIAPNDYVGKTKDYIDAGYYLAKNGIVNFQYTGEYNQSDLRYKLYDENGIEILTSSYSLNVYGGSGVLKENSDNRYTIDLESNDEGLYLLEITNVKSEKHFLRIRN